ncbi:unnamed protein product [Anisakis simplex]|uniref:PDZ domain-containing protein n=1 Tax=Anisakis simplex TaxID=6269 RepID=A0A0M3JET0_ANISI|nr:unnamed protein product [Anisakis simplex]
MPKRGSRSGTDTASEVDLEKASEMFPKISTSSKRSSTQLDSGSQRPSDASDRVVDDESKTETIGDNESTDQQLNRRSRESSTPEEELSEGSEGSRFAVTLTKDPKIGLGLTLVDGNLNGIKGVYVKSVTDDGPGKKNGVNVGDRLMSVNGVSLVGKDRHATVDLVRQSGSVVRLSIFR